MPDQPPAASGIEVEAPPATPEESSAVTPTYTREQIAEMARNRDADGLRKANEALRGVQSTQPPAAPADQPPHEQQRQDDAGIPPADGSQPNKKFFTIQYQGQEQKYDDTDNYFGYGNFGRMKKAMAHQRATISNYEKLVSSAQDDAGSARAQLNAVMAERDDLRERLNTPPPQPPAPLARPEQPPAPPPSTAAPEIPEPPTPPQLSSRDPLEWTDQDREAMRVYDESRVSYDKAVRQALIHYGTQRPAANYQNDPALVNQVEELSTRVKNLTQETETVSAAKKLDDFWKGLDSFQSLHNEELSTEQPLRVIHDAVGKWTTALARANGVVLEQGATAQQLADYTYRKKVLVEKYLAGDPAVKENAQAVPPPDGYEQYFKVADVQAKHKKLVAQGVLGPNSSLQDAWKHTYTERQLNDDINALEATARADGSNAVLNNLQGHQRHDAIHIPNNAGGQAPEQKTPGTISKDEAMRILRMPINEVRRNPELWNLRKQIIERARPV